MNTESFAVIIRRNRWREMRATVNTYIAEGWSLIGLSRSDGDAVIIFERNA